MEPVLHLFEPIRDARAFRDELQALGDTSELTLRIHSEGGDILEGFSIYHQLLAHPARVVVEVQVLAASMASVVAMAADEIRLAENGFLTLKDGVTKGQKGDITGYADMSQTQAYSMGMAYIYLNLKGRPYRLGKEVHDGIVDPAEADRVKGEIRDALLAAVDPNTGENICTEVYFPRELHDGPSMYKEADVLPGFAPGYRVSWGSSGGGINLEEGEDGEVVLGPAYEPNDSTWSGGHVSVDLEAVKGIFFCSEPMVLPDGGPDVLHIAPTVLSLLGIEPPAAMDLAPLERAGS